MSMQIRAQLYIVHVYAENIDTNADGMVDDQLHYMTTISPDGSISTIEVPDFLNNGNIF